jgi:hypothetical protein
MPASESHGIAIAFLKLHSADQIPHFNGSLLSHLESTTELLRNWGNPQDLCLAGLCHAAYGTDGFPLGLIEVSGRSELQQAIGPDAEQLVHFYASCDRSFLYPRIAGGLPLEFRDRFTGTVSVPDSSIFSSFLELTFANELDIALGNPDFVEQHGAGLARLLGPCRSLVSDGAYKAFLGALGRWLS